jgi:hypothetical protein
LIWNCFGRNFLDETWFSQIYVCSYDLYGYGIPRLLFAIPVIYFPRYLGGNSSKNFDKQKYKFTRMDFCSFDVPRPNPTTSSYNASAVNFYNATGSLACFENKNISFYFE